MRTASTPVTRTRGFWLVFVAAMIVALTSALLQRLTRSVDAGFVLRRSYLLAAIWLLLQALAVGRYRWRGLWLLFGLPIVLYWPIAFKLLEYGCRHEVNACP